MPIIKVISSKLHQQYSIYLYIIICLLSLAGCQKKQQPEIRGVTGKLNEKFILISDTSSNVKYISYHQNGTIKEEGYLLHGKREGIWKQFYNDGALRWLGRYRNGRSVVPELDSIVVNYTSIVKKGLTADGYYAFRLKLPDSLSHRNIMYSCTNAHLRLNPEYDSTDFELKPKIKKEGMVLLIYANSGYANPIFGTRLDTLYLNSNK